MTLNAPAYKPNNFQESFMKICIFNAVLSGRVRLIRQVERDSSVNQPVKDSVLVTS